MNIFFYAQFIAPQLQIRLSTFESHPIDSIIGVMVPRNTSESLACAPQKMQDEFIALRSPGENLH